jgi:hypothetical protein
VGHPARHSRTAEEQPRWGFDIFEKLGEEKVRGIAKGYAEENKEKFTV